MTCYVATHVVTYPLCWPLDDCKHQNNWCRFMTDKIRGLNLINYLCYNKHLYLSDVWLGVVLRKHTKKTYVHKISITILCSTTKPPLPPPPTHTDIYI